MSTLSVPLEFSCLFYPQERKLQHLLQEQSVSRREKKNIYISDKVQGAIPEHRTRKFPLCTTAIDHVFFFYDTNTPKEGELHERILYESLGLGPWNRQLLLELAVMQCLLPSSRKRRPGNR